MATLAGNPSVLKAQADGLERSASKIRDAVADLRKFAIQSRSDAVYAVSRKVQDVAQGVNEAHDRYQATASALQEYQVTLAEAHRRADEAADRNKLLNREIGPAEQRARALKNHVVDLHNTQAPAPTIRHAQEQLEDARYRLRSLRSRSADAEAEIEAARKMVREAGDRAASRIDLELRRTNDNLLDKLGQFVDGLKKAFTMIGQWVATVLRTMLEAISKVLTVVFKVVLAIIKAIVIAVVLVAAAIAAVVVIALVTAILAAVALTVTALVMVTAVVLISALALTIALSAYLVAAIIVALPLLLKLAVVGLGIGLSILFIKDMINPTIRQREYAPDDDSELATYERNQNDFKSQQEEKNAGKEYGIDRLMASMADVDTMGNTESAVVEIKKIDGDPPRWVVTIPSTQDWWGGAPNDWPHNVPLKLLPPDVPTAYERAVLKAMRDAGIGPNDPVMVQGFSQGGIMAARLAANPNSGFNVTGVVTVGSPVADIKIPNVSPTGDPVHVVSLQHKTDPVHKLDNPLFNYESDENRRSFYLPDPVDSTTGEVKHNGEAHNAELYRRSMVKVLEDNPSINKDFEQFLQRPIEQTLVEIEE